MEAPYVHVCDACGGQGLQTLAEHCGKVPAALQLLTLHVACVCVNGGLKFQALVVHKARILQGSPPGSALMPQDLFSFVFCYLKQG